MKIVVILVLMLAVSNVRSEEYKPLTNKDKKEFIKAYESITAAYSNTNYDVIKRYCPDIIEKYGAIDLDMRSKELRPKLKQLGIILADSKRLSVKDSLLTMVHESLSKNDYEACAERYQDLFKFIDSEGCFDSLKKTEMPKLYDCIKKMYEENPNYRTFGKMDSYKYSDRQYVDKLRSKIENGFEEKLLQLSSEMNIDSLINFQKNFPGIYVNDVTALIEKAKDKYRLSVLRNISPAAVQFYYDRFGGPNEELETSLERNMWNKFDNQRTKEVAEDYALRFPKGKYIEIIKTFITGSQDNVTSNDYIQSEDSIFR